MTKKPTTPTTSNQTPKADADQKSLPIAPNSQVTLTIPWATVEPAYTNAVKALAQRIKVDGFRQGKLPFAMAEERVDQSAVLERTLQKVLPPVYTAELEKTKQLPLTQPEIEPVKAEKGQDWEITVYFAVRPSITLGQYRPVVIEAIQASQKDIVEEEKKLAEKVGEEKVPAISEKKETSEIPATPITLTDQQKEDFTTRYIFKALVEEINPQIPELLVRREANRDLDRLLNQLTQLKLSVDDYLKSRQLTPDQLRQEYMAVGVSALQIEFILAEIAKAEKFTVEDKEIDKTLTTMAGGKITDELLQNPDYRTAVFSTLLKQKVAKFLLSLSKN